MADKEEVGGSSLVIWLIFLGVSLATGGMWQTEVKYTPTVRGTLINQIQFEENIPAEHWVFGFVQGKQPDVSQVLSKYLREGEQLSEIIITTKHTPFDIFFAGITLGIYNPVTVSIRGTFGKYVDSENQLAVPDQTTNEEPPKTNPEKEAVTENKNKNAVTVNSNKYPKSTKKNKNSNSKSTSNSNTVASDFDNKNETNKNSAENDDESITNKDVAGTNPTNKNSSTTRTNKNSGISPVNKEPKAANKSGENTAKPTP